MALPPSAPFSSSSAPSLNDGTTSNPPSVVLYSTSPDSSRRSSIIGRPPPADLFSSLVSDNVSKNSPIAGNPLPGTASRAMLSPVSSATSCFSEDGTESMSRRPSVVSFTEPVGHADRSRSVGSLFHLLHHHNHSHGHGHGQGHHGHNHVTVHSSHSHSISFGSRSGKHKHEKHEKYVPSTSREPGSGDGATLRPSASAKAIPPRVSSMIIDPISTSAPGPLSFSKITPTIVVSDGKPYMERNKSAPETMEVIHGTIKSEDYQENRGPRQALSFRTPFVTPKPSTATVSTTFSIPNKTEPKESTHATPVTNQVQNLAQLSSEQSLNEDKVNDRDSQQRHGKAAPSASTITTAVATAAATAATAATTTTTTSTSPSVTPATATDTKSPNPGDAEESEEEKIHILVAATGSVATIKIPLIIAKLRKIYGSHASIQLIVTTAAEHFLQGVKLPCDVKVWHDHDEWTSRRGVAEAVLHVQLRRWADILLIAPLSANTLAKMANGICDNLITSVFRAWNSTTPVVVAPAMNTHMYTNPMTKKHLAVLHTAFPYVQVLKPVEKVLVCGDIGMGGMREWTDVVDNVVRKLGGPPLSVEEEEEEEEREKREKRAAKKRRESSVPNLQADIPNESNDVNNEIHHDEDEDDDDDDDDDDDEHDDDDDDDDDDEDDDDNNHTYNPSFNHAESGNGQSSSPHINKPAFVRSNTADI